VEAKRPCERPDTEVNKDNSKVSRNEIRCAGVDRKYLMQEWRAVVYTVVNFPIPQKEASFSSS
jgi:hypothetical protein